MTHSCLAKGVGLGARSKETIDREWNDLANKLNAHGGGATKTGQRWKRYWADLKFKVKHRAAARKREASGTGGGPATLDELCEMDRKVLAIIGEGAVYGDTQHRVPAFISSDSQLAAAAPNTSSLSFQHEEIVMTSEASLEPPPSPLPVPPPLEILSPSSRGQTSRAYTTEATPLAPGSPRRPISRPRRVHGSPVSRRPPLSRNRSSSATRRTGQRADPSWVVELERRRVDAESKLADAAIITAEAARTQAEAARVQAEASRMQAEAFRRDHAAALNKLIDILIKK